MKQPIYGRDRERKVLESAYASSMAEFITLYGRRRVGKTYLVRNLFSDVRGAVFFYVTGNKKGSKADQLEHFFEEMKATFKFEKPNIPKTWKDAFRLLTDQINKSRKRKIVLFFDEFPWMVTDRSGLLDVLEDYWNHRWSRDPRIKLIICGSSAEWILENILNDLGGFYQRVTQRIRLQPFSLGEAKGYLAHRGIHLSNKQVAQIYMVLGGIPHYLNQVPKGLSSVQVIEYLAFGQDSFLMSEFENLYATLFERAEGHIALARAIAEHHYGIGQEELAKKVEGITSGEGLIGRLKDLEETGFVRQYKPYEHQTRGIYYKMIDEYSLFYFRWIEPIRDTLLEMGMSPGYWMRRQQLQTWKIWAGYAFESLCLNHIPQINRALGLSPLAIPYTWRYTPEKGSGEAGAQVDLLFDRDDDAVTLCEIKYTSQPFYMTKECANKFAKRALIFKKKTNTDKEIFLALISANGAANSMYLDEMISGVVTLEDLFASIT